MPAPFKDQINTGSVAALAQLVVAVDPDFPASAFVRDAGAGLGALELKARVRHVAGSLGRHLAGSFPDQATVLEAALDGAGVPWWVAWPVVEHLGAAGHGDPGRALHALGRLTRYATAEFAVRDYLDQHTDVAWSHVWRWARSDDLHRRRLASEGTRPRLPWGRAVGSLREPGVTVALLDHLRGDPEEYVRRSVANHVGDIARDHPDRAVGVCRRWLADPDEHTDRTVRHALRGLLRAGHPEALDLLGFAPTDVVVVEAVTVGPRAIAVGEHLIVAARLTNTGDRPLRVLLQYALAGPSRRRVYYLGERSLPPGRTTVITRRHRVRDTTTRRAEQGPLDVELLVNGLARVAGCVTVRNPG